MTSRRPSWEREQPAACILCGSPLDEDENNREIPYLSLWNAGYLSDNDPDAAILAESCKGCAADASDGVVSILFPPQ
ncbi:MAG: hypothetical protein OXE76_12790 [Alphaproteobacteria bacterium]|nr:hypothetical protein [Alphaproteobacteria bacterium]